jgi:hypothetical protein
MRLPGVLAALGVLVLVPAARAAAGPLGTATPLVRVGPGVTENSQRQVVRTADGVVYIAAVDDDGYGDRTPAELHMYRATSAGIPTAFTSADAADDPRADELSGGDARIDAAGTVHLTYVVADTGDGSLTVRYQTFDTRRDEWGPAHDVARLDSGGDGARGRVVSALALDRTGAPLIVTASDGGVSAWTPSGDGAWSRGEISGDPRLHPSLAIDGSGRALLAWLSSPYDDASIRFAARAPDGTWSKPEVVAADDVLTNATLDQGPSLAFDADARPIVLWLDRKDDVRLAVRGGDGWARDDPPGVFAHSPGLYVRGEERFALLGHDLLTHPAYVSRAAGASAWSSVGVFPPPPDVDGSYAYDGSASARFDPLFDADCRIVDVAFFAEYSLQVGRIGKPDLYYAAVRLPAAAGGCPSSVGQPPSEEPPPREEPPPSEEPPAPAALLGADGVGEQVDHNPPGMAEAFQATAAASGTLRALTVYVDASSTADRIAVGLYADADGHPGELLARGAADAKAGGWNAVTIPDARVGAGERYWVALLGTGGGELAFRDEHEGGCRSETTPPDLALDALPGVWTTGSEFDDCPLSAYGA